MSKHNRICRTCLATCRGYDFISVYIKYEDNFRICDYIEKFFGILISREDTLPENICTSCAKKLYDINEFYQKCKESENYLRNCVNISTNKINMSSNNEFHEKNSVIKMEIMSDEEILNKCEPISSKKETEENYGLMENSDLIKKETMYCDICNEDFKYKKNLKYHMIMAHNQIFDLGIQIDQEKKSKREDLVKECEMQSLKEKKTIKYDRLFQCSICNAKFKFGNNFLTHLKRHKEEIKIDSLQKCPYNKCEEEFFTSESLEKHFSKVHLEKNNRFLSPKCGENLLSRKAYTTHQLKHKKKTEFKCKYCDKILASKSHLISHEHTHTGELPFKCQICKRCFRQTSSLKTHMTLHVGKPVGCPFCDKKFSRKGILRIHLRSHTNERPFACELCPKRFFQMCHLRSHLVSHTSERPYICNICHMTFAKKEILRRHLYKHSSKKPYKCPDCTLETASSFWFRKHLKQAHNIQEDIQQFKQYVPISGISVNKKDKEKIEKV